MNGCKRDSAVHVCHFEKRGGGSQDLAQSAPEGGNKQLAQHASKGRVALLHGGVPNKVFSGPKDIAHLTTSASKKERWGWDRASGHVRGDGSTLCVRSP